MTELFLGLLALGITVFGYVLVQLADTPNLPPDLWAILAAVSGLFVVAHLAVRKFAPEADPTLLPLTVLLTGFGFVMISRLDRDLARVQAVWAAVGVLAFVLTLALVRRVRTLERYRYTFLFLGVAALLLPSLPGIGKEINGARLWVGVGPLNFQPGEAAKVLLVVFFAAYLVDKRELLTTGTRHIGRVTLPDPPGQPKNTEGIQGSPSHGIGITPDGKVLWATSKWYHYIAAYSMPDLKPLGIVPVGHEPDWLTFTPDSKTVYVACAGSNYVSAVDVKALKEVTRIAVGQVPKRNITAVLQ